MRTLSAYPGVYNVRSDLNSERIEVEVALKPSAQALGITRDDVARQVRQGFYGDEVQHIPRAKEDVRVMVRYLARERQTLEALENIRIRTADGRQLPLSAVADLLLVPGASTIHRVDRRRNITLTANVEEGHDAQRIANTLLTENHVRWRCLPLCFALWCSRY